MKKVFTGVAALLFMGSVAFAQDNTKSKATTDKTAKSEKKSDAVANCKTTAKGKSCCQQPSKTASLRMAAAAKKPKTAQ
ncbi:hypothetical protein [Chitinophaga sp. MM2321]|uniref:hypothetical protein n=1 Tax=Chitinophaga sp. MM2321 TaxID=3137178 RepID=UPI0032D575A4